MIVSMIAAIANNRVIGINNQLPWHLPEDLAWFKKNTLNKPIIMGRKTWESLPFKPLPGRKNIIITRDQNYQPLDSSKDNGKILEQVAVVASIEQALTIEEKLADEVMIIGGASVYEQALPLIDRLYLTNIHHDFDGDAYFPDYQQYQWQQSYIESNQSQANDKNSVIFQYDFLILDKHSSL